MICLDQFGTNVSSHTRIHIATFSWEDRNHVADY